jgi:hypothetical protein
MSEAKDESALDGVVMCKKEPVFVASTQTKYCICYEQPDQPGRLKFYKTCESLEQAEAERLEIINDPLFSDYDVRIREETTKVCWYNYNT